MRDDDVRENRDGGAAGRRTLRSVANALRLVEALADADRPLGVNELGRRLGVAPSTAHRLLATLAARGFAARLPGDRRYRRGPALVRLSGRTALAEHLRLREAAHPVLERLANTTNETVHLGVLDGFDVVSIDHVESTQPIVARHPVGSQLPAHATAVGQALLAFLPEAAEAIGASALERLTARTVTDPGALERVLDAVRQYGYAVNVGQWYPGSAGVAAPVRGDGGQVVAALGISGPARRINRPVVLAGLGEQARTAAAEITRRSVRLGPAGHG